MSFKSPGGWVWPGNITSPRWGEVGEERRDEPGEGDLGIEMASMSPLSLFAE